MHHWGLSAQSVTGELGQSFAPHKSGPRTESWHKDVLVLLEEEEETTQLPFSAGSSQLASCLAINLLWSLIYRPAFIFCSASSVFRRTPFDNLPWKTLSVYNKHAGRETVVGLACWCCFFRLLEWQIYSSSLCWYLLLRSGRQLNHKHPSDFEKKAKEKKEKCWGHYNSLCFQRATEGVIKKKKRQIPSSVDYTRNPLLGSYLSLFVLKKESSENACVFHGIEMLY